MTPALALLIGLAVVFAITAATAWFVAQEFAFMAVDRSRTAARADAGDDAAAKTLAVTSRTSFMLSGAQLGITVTGLVVGYVAEPMIGGSLAQMGESSGAPRALAATVGAIVAILVSTVVQMVLGELFPKNFAIARSAQVADRLAPSTLVYLRLFGPFIWLFDKAAEGLLRLLRLEPVHDVEHSATARDLKHIVEESRDSGDLTPELSTMVDRILEFPARHVNHAMIPRARVDVVSSDVSIAEMRVIMQGGHTRYPVVEDDEVVGVVELLDVLARSPHDAHPVSSIMQPPVTMSEYVPLPEALHMLQAARAQMAVVIDEFGGFTGVISVEDLAEEVVGEIEDEHDPDDLAAIAPDSDADDAWVCPGGTPIDEVERALGVELVNGDFESIGGAAMSHHGGFVDVGETVTIELEQDPGDWATQDEPRERSLHAEVTAVENHVPRWVRLRVVTHAKDEEDA